MKRSGLLLALFLAVHAPFLWASPATQEATVRVTERGFEPGRLELAQGVLAQVTFIRETQGTCATEVILPEYDIEATLPLNERVTIEFTPGKSGQFSFACGMDMIRGKLVVSEN